MAKSVSSAPRRSRLAPRERGFTLVEVLVALAILAIALAAVVRVIAQAIDLTAGLRDRTIALGIAQDQLVLHHLKRDWPALDTFNGTSEQAGRTWRWQERVMSTPVDDFRRIEIDVRNERDEVMAHLIAFLRKPPS